MARATLKLRGCHRRRRRGQGGAKLLKRADGLHAAQQAAQACWRQVLASPLMPLRLSAPLAPQPPQAGRKCS